MKKTALVFVLLLMFVISLMLMTGCSKKEAPQTQPEQTNVQQETPTQTDTTATTAPETEPEAAPEK